jgi:hypothetical protein
VPTKQFIGEVVEAAETRRYEHFILDAYQQRRDSMSDYYANLRKLDSFIDGDWTLELPNGRVLRTKPVIENRILSKVEDTGYQASEYLPTISVHPLDERDFNNASLREQIFQYYWQNSEVDLFLPHLYMDMLLTGVCAMQVWPDFTKPITERFPTFKRLDPRHIMPPLDWMVNGEVEPHDVIVAQSRKIRDLIRDYPQLAQLLGGNKGIKDTASVGIIKYFGRDAVVRLAVAAQNKPVVLDAFYNETECCPVVLGARPTADGKIRGKVNAMIPPLTAENRLMTYMIEYADRAVYAPVTKKGDVANAEDYGPDAVIDLGVSGEVGRLSPPPLQQGLFATLANLEQESRRAGNHPEARAGSVHQSIISAAGVQSLMGPLATEIIRLQRVVETMLRRANSAAGEQDKIYCNTRKSILLAQGGSTRLRYTPSEDLKDTTNYVSYGAGSGLDKENALIRMTQLERSGYVPKRWVREQLDGIPSIAQVEEQLQDEMALMAVMQGILARAASGDLAPLGEFQRIRKEKGNVLEAVQAIAALAAGPVQPSAGGTPGPQPQPQTAAAEALALEKGGIPGNAPDLPGGGAEAGAGLPPLAQLGLAG